MSTKVTETRYIRLPVEIIVQVNDPDAVRTAARAAVNAVADMPEDERAEALERIDDEDIADAVALVVDLEGLLPTEIGLEVVEATWSAEEDHNYELIDDEE